jgi:branched-chain amino acid transport system substrate-binding protein
MECPPIPDAFLACGSLPHGKLTLTVARKEDMSMGRKRFFILVAAVTAVCFVMGAGQVFAAEKKKEAPEQYMPVISYWTGPFAAGGSGIAGGWEDFMELMNIEGGVNGIKYEWDECEDGYNVARGIECYERDKTHDPKPVVIHPISTGITYALIPKGVEDHISIVFEGYGRADAADGEVFKWAFNFPIHYWSEITAKIKWIAMKQGWDGRDMETMGKYLKGVKIANLYIDVPYGQETKPILDDLSKTYGFELRHFPVSWPGIDQKAQWMDIARRYKADWVINRNWGVSCTVPLKEAARLGFPADHIVGIWWCGSEEDVLPAGPAAKGYYSSNFHGVGKDFPIIQRIIEKVYGTMKGHISFTRVGTVYYNRGVLTGITMHEALLTAQKKFGKKVITGEEMRWALEHLNITQERINEMGAEGFMQPIKTSCEDHEGGGKVFFQQWNGEKWVATGDVVEPMKSYVRKMVVESAEKYAKEKDIPIRDCSKEE